MNGDGLIDLASANYLSHSISVSYRHRTGFYGLLPVLYPTAGTYPMAIVSGQFNGDGFRDFAVTLSGTNQAADLHGDGSGGYSAPVLVAVGEGPQKIVAGDLNGDGRSDLVVSNSSTTTLSILLQSSTGGFTFSQQSISVRARWAYQSRISTGMSIRILPSRSRAHRATACAFFLATPLEHSPC